MRNKLHRIHRVKLGAFVKLGGQPPMEAVACGCNLSKDHTESYDAYVKRARKEGYT